MAERLNVIDVPQQPAARVAGFAYLIPVAFVVYANFTSASRSGRCRPR